MDLIRYSFSLLNQCLIVVVTLGLCWKCLQLKLEKTAMHAFFCTLGFVTLMAEGMMVRYRGNPFSVFMHEDTKTTLHFLLQFIGGLMGIFGTVHKVVAKEQHFKSLHAKLGLAACVFCFINFMSGALALYSDSYRAYLSPLANGLIHNSLGLVTFLTAMAAQYYGYETGFFRRNYENRKEFYKLLTVLICALTVLGPIQMLASKLFKLYA